MKTSIAELIPYLLLVFNYPNPIGIPMKPHGISTGIRWCEVQYV